MEQTDWLFWAIAFAFYLPLHAGAPFLYLLIQGDIERLKAKKNTLLIHSLLSATVAFGIAIYAWPQSHGAAVSVIIGATFLPWLGLRKSA